MAIIIETLAIIILAIFVEALVEGGMDIGDGLNLDDGRVDDGLDLGNGRSDDRSVHFGLRELRFSFAIDLGCSGDGSL